jgi:uncharacterized membrane-anchored protein
MLLTRIEPIFDHDKLDVYALELQVVTWTTDFLEEVSQSPVSGRRELVDQLDGASISVLLFFIKTRLRRLRFPMWRLNMRAPSRQELKRKKIKFMNETARNELSKVPAVTLTFWVIKILATTLGETGGDSVSMSMNLGYVIASIIFLSVFVVLVAAQVAAKSFHPFLYWSVIVATTTLGTTLADFADRSLGIGYAGGSLLLFILLMASLGIWYKSAGSVSVETITSPKVEIFYWVTILFSQTLGTALGDWMADTNGLGYEGGALVFGAGLALVAAGYLVTSVSRTLLFWAAFILTRPLGATLGDLLDKPVDHGGFAFSRYGASGILAALIVATILFLPQKAGGHPGQGQKAS